MDAEILKQHLDQVIIRIDFLAPADFISDSIPANLNAAVMESFPIAEPRELLSQELQFTSAPGQQKIEQKNQKITEWNYYGRDREKQFSITKDHFFIVYKKYDSFLALQKD